MVEEHKHCMVCGRAVAGERFFCSPACEDMFRKHQARLRRTRLFMLLILVVVFLILIVGGMLRS